MWSVCVRFRGILHSTQKLWQPTTVCSVVLKVQDKVHLFWLDLVRPYDYQYLICPVDITTMKMGMGKEVKFAIYSKIHCRKFSYVSHESYLKPISRLAINYLKIYSHSYGMEFLLILQLFFSKHWWHLLKAFLNLPTFFLLLPIL